jgi:hypothetical protein
MKLNRKSSRSRGRKQQKKKKKTKKQSFFLSGNKAQVVEHLASKCQALSSNPHTAKKAFKVQKAG